MGLIDGIVNDVLGRIGVYSGLCYAEAFGGPGFFHSKLSYN